MDFFPLEIFPHGSLSSSVITTVWLGVIVVAFFNLRFGWVLSGLVVPGYLVPLLLIKPWAVLAIFVEGVSAYYIVWFFSEYLSRFGLWGALFGRDRFFALILASIATRVGFDGWLLPSFGFWLEGYGLVFDYRNELHSLGLVIVALVANQFWKTGLIKGLPPFIITLLVTWFIVKYLLIPYTNFGLGGLSYMYEDIAASILASPKAYIILVTTAFVASRMNLRYGWDFNGILIPALLALQWYQPSKILISFVEAFIILGLASATMRLPVFANATIEGARKLLFFFNIGFAYKILLSYSIIYFAPEVKISDFFAFGYLLSTLLAIKMHDKGIIIRMTRATVQTSLVSIFVASVIGFILTIVPSFQPWTMAIKAEKVTPLVKTQETLLNRLLKIKPEMYRSRFSEMVVPLPQEIDLFSDATKLLLEYSHSKDQPLLEQALSHYQQIGYQVELLETQYLLISQTDNRQNWGIYVINLKAENELLVELPSPLEERGLIEGVGVLFKTLNARSLAIAGGNSEAFQSQSLFDGFHRLAGRRDALQVHTYTKEIERSLLKTEKKEIEKNSEVIGELWVKNRLPPSLNMANLEKVLGKYQTNWGELDYKNLQRESSREGYAELIINRKGLRRLLIGPLLNATKTPEKIGDQKIAGYLQEWLLGQKGQIAESGTNSYQIPKTEELIYLDEEVLTALVSVIKSGFHNGQWSNEALEELQTINSAAGVLGYELLRYSHSGTGENYLILAEVNQATSGSEKKSGGLLKSRYWGTYVFRLGETAPYVLQSPRPLYEVNSFEVAVSLFERMQAKALLIGGTHPLTNQDHSSDLVRSENQLSLFTLVNQVLMRESLQQPLLSIQCRALGQQPGQQLPDADMLISFDDGAVLEQSFSLLQNKLYETLTADQWKLRFVDGSIETSGYQVGGTPQARYVNASESKGFALLWVSPLVRSSFKQQREDDSLSIQFISLDIPSVENDLFRQVDRVNKASKNTLEPILLTLIKGYQDTLDVILLKKIAALDKKLSRVIDKNSKQAFLLVHNVKGELALVANLNPLDIHSVKHLTINNFSQPSVNSFIETRTARLELVSE